MTTSTNKEVAELHNLLADLDKRLKTIEEGINSMVSHLDFSSIEGDVNTIRDGLTELNNLIN